MISYSGLLFGATLYMSRCFISFPIRHTEAGSAELDVKRGLVREERVDNRLGSCTLDAFRLAAPKA